MNNEKIYTAADFASYHAGTMPAKDMHVLERAALEDPFLSDALDGYVHTKTAVADIETLKGKLLPKEKNEIRVVAIPSNKNWMRAAASIAIVFGLGYLFYSVNKKDDGDSSLADNKVQQEIKANTVTADTNKIDEAINATTETLPTASQTNSAPSNGSIKLDTTTLQLADNNFNTTPSSVISRAPASPPVSNSAELAIESKVAEPLQKNALEDDAKDKEAKLDLVQNNRVQNNAMNFYNYNGVVQTATGGPMQNATIKLKNSNIVTQTDNKGRYNFTAADSVANVSIAAIGYDKKEALLNSNASQVLRLDNKSSGLDEVVVTATASAKRKSTAIASSNAKVSEKTLSGKVSGVNTDWEAVDKYAAFKKQKAVEIDSSKFHLEAKSFYNYVKQHIKPEVDNFGIKYEGQVILSFTVNKHGDPRNIKVVKSLSEKCDAQAKKLLESGPSWYFPKGEIRTVIIEF